MRAPSEDWGLQSDVLVVVGTRKRVLTLSGIPVNMHRDKFAIHCILHSGRPAFWHPQTSFQKDLVAEWLVN